MISFQIEDLSVLEPYCIHICNLRHLWLTASFYYGNYNKRGKAQVVADSRKSQAFLISTCLYKLIQFGL